ncbi:MAG: MFS transporter [Capsulimonas sp.]|uniref:MFS transporter n=1 Tax=Capsulimonas sp. TaxID=2494211 RepID=UPI003262E941
MSDVQVLGASRGDRIYNFFSCVIDSIGWPLGMAFFSNTIILPVFLAHLGASDLLVGCVPALMNLLITLPGFLVVPYLSRRRRVRGFLFWIALLERFALLPLAPLTLILGVSHPQWMIAALFGCLTVHATMMGLNQPAYWMAVGKTIPSHWRGRLYGVAGGIGGVLSIGVERLLSHLLSGPNGGFPGGYSKGFLIGFLILTFTVLPLGLLREPDSPVVVDKSAHPPFAGELKRVLQGNHSFRQYLYAQTAFQLAAGVTPFYILYAQRDIGANTAAIAAFTGVMICVTAFGGLGWGAWADRAGNKVVLLSASVCAVLAPIAALIAHAPVEFYAVFVLLALLAAASNIAAANIVMEFASEAHEIGLYMSIANVVTALPRTVATLLGGAVASFTHGYRVGFALSAVLALVSLLLTLRVTEPRIKVERPLPPGP